MALGNLPPPQRLIDLGNEIAIWRVHLDYLRDQDRNAQVMEPEKLKRLAENIGKDQRMEQLIFAHMQTIHPGTPDESLQFSIISGHHRARAARMAGVLEIPIMVHEGELTRSQVRAKQLAHNALVGHSDPQMLAELYAELETINDKLESGLTDLEADYETSGVQVDEVRVDVDYEFIHLVFLPLQHEKWKDALDRLSEDAAAYIADKRDFDRFADLLRDTARRFSIRNIAGILLKMVEVVEETYKATTPEDRTDEWVGLTFAAGCSLVPPSVRVKFQKAIKKLGVKGADQWQVIDRALDALLGDGQQQGQDPGA